MKPTGFAFFRPCVPSKGQGHKNWYKMAVKGAYKHGKYDKLGLNSLQETIKFFPRKDSWTNMTDNIDPYATRMDTKCF